MRPPALLANYANVRGALFLWHYLSNYTPAVATEWQPVGSGFAFSDEYLGAHLDVAAATVRRWRMRLETLGYLKSEVIGPRRRRFWLLNPFAPEVAAEPAAAVENQRVN